MKPSTMKPTTLNSKLNRKPRTTAKRNQAHFNHAILRDSIPVPFMFSLGALTALTALTVTLLPLPSPLPFFTPLLLALLSTAYFPFRALLSHWGITENQRRKGVVDGKARAVIPGTNENGPPEFAIVHLCARSNAPLGLFDPNFLAVGRSFRAMQKELESDPDSGVLNIETYISTQRKTGNSQLFMFYFESVEHVWKFASGILHKSAWMDLARNPSKGYDVELSHELFTIKESGFEALYLNCEPHGAGEIYAQDEEGVWQRTLRPFEGKGPDRKDGRSRDRMGVTKF